MPVKRYGVGGKETYSLETSTYYNNIKAEHSVHTLIGSRSLYDTVRDLKDYLKAVPGASNSQEAFPRVLDRKTKQNKTKNITRLILDVTPQSIRCK